MWFHCLRAAGSGVAFAVRCAALVGGVKSLARKIMFVFRAISVSCPLRQERMGVWEREGRRDRVDLEKEGEGDIREGREGWEERQPQVVVNLSQTLSD